MNKPLDPYEQWLGISPEQQPPHHYWMLGLKVFEEDQDIIQQIAEDVKSWIQIMSDLVVHFQTTINADRLRVNVRSSPNSILSQK